tara:strand:+ start:203 stop:406 length:204 start_codon:yes stop_codon:yes gene_type:complete
MKFKNAKEAIDALILKAQKDNEFKKSLIKKPKEVMRGFGIGIPEKYKVIVSDQSQENTFYLNIPAKK